MLYGDIKGDVYGNGGEVELIQVNNHQKPDLVTNHVILKEPASIYGAIRIFPINRIDKSAIKEDIQRIIDQEKTKLSAISLKWPQGNAIQDEAIFTKNISIG